MTPQPRDRRRDGSSPNPGPLSSMAFTLSPDLTDLLQVASAGVGHPMGHRIIEINGHSVVAAPLASSGCSQNTLRWVGPCGRSQLWAWSSGKAQPQPRPPLHPQVHIKTCRLTYRLPHRPGAARCLSSTAALLPLYLSPCIPGTPSAEPPAARFPWVSRLYVIFGAKGV